MIFPIDQLLAAMDEQKRLAKLPYNQLPIEERERRMSRRLRELKLKLLEQEVTFLETLIRTPNQEP